MSRREHPSEVEARRFAALDDLLAAPCELPAGLEDRLVAIPDAAGRMTRRGYAVLAAAVVLAAGALALHVVGGVRTTAHEPGVARESASPRRPDRVVVALRHPSETGRAFLEAQGDRILVTLHRLARDRDAAVAVPAIERLGALARRASLPVLVDVVRRPDRRAAALGALGALGDPAAARAVAPYLSDPGLRVLARDALAAMGGRDAVAALRAALDGSARPDALVQALGRIRDPAAVVGLLGLLERPGPGAVAREALGARHHRAALLAIAGGRDRPLALAAIRTIEHLALPEAVPLLRGALADAARREAAARALAAIDTPAAGQALLDGLGARGVRAAFADAGPGIETWLLARIATGDRRERRRVVDLLALCGTDRSVAALESLAADPALATAVVATLGRVGGPAAIAALEGLCKHSALRHPVVEALADTASPDAVPALVRLGGADRALRRPVITALGRIPHPAAVRAILALDGRSATRRTTTRTLRTMDRDTVVPTLLALLDGAEAAEARRWLDTVCP